MRSFQVTPEILQQITDSMSTHVGALNRELTDMFGDDVADAAFMIALCMAIVTTLSSFSDQGEVVAALNNTMTLLRQPWRLASVS